MIKIKGTRSHIVVEMDDKKVKIPGEMVVGGFIAFKSGIKEWTSPENVLVTEEEKNEIIRRVEEKTAGSHMVITFE